MNNENISDKLNRIEASVDSIRKEIGYEGKVIEDVATGVTALNTNLKETRAEVVTLNNTISERDVEISNLNSTIEVKDSHISGLEEANNNMEAEIIGLRDDVTALEQKPIINGCYNVYTEDEMNALPNIKDGDVCVISINGFGPHTETQKFNKVLIASTVVLPAPIPNESYVSYRSKDCPLTATLHADQVCLMLRAKGQNFPGNIVYNRVGSNDLQWALDISSLGEGFNVDAVTELYSDFWFEPRESQWHPSFGYFIQVENKLNKIYKFIEGRWTLIDENASEEELRILYDQIEAQNMEIAELSNSVTQLSVEVSEKAMEIEEKNATIAEQEAEIEELKASQGSGSSGLYQVASIEELNRLLEV